MKTTSVGPRCVHCAAALARDAAACPQCGAIISYSSALARRSSEGFASLVAYRNSVLKRWRLQRDARTSAWARRPPHFVEPSAAGDDEPGVTVAWVPIGFVGPHPVESPYQVEVKLASHARPFVSYALQHCGRGAVERLSIQNLSESVTAPAIVEVRLAPDGYGEPWVAQVPALWPREQWRADNVRLPLSLERLKAVRETEHAQLQVRIRRNDAQLYAQGTDIAVHAYNEWVAQRGFLELTAAFVQSNDAALAAVLQAAIPRLAEQVGERAFCGYQKRQPEYVFAMLDALHTALSEDFSIAYINPQPSHERTGQKLQLVAETLASRAGTCFDLAVLQAALWERIGLAPLIVLVPGHALLGCWMREPDGALPPVVTLGANRRQTSQYVEMMNQRALLMVNSVEPAHDQSLPEACEHAAGILNNVMSRGGRVDLIDIAAARRAQPPITPLP